MGKGCPKGSSSTPIGLTNLTEREGGTTKYQVKMGARDDLRGGDSNRPLGFALRTLPNNNGSK